MAGPSHLALAVAGSVAIAAGCGSGARPPIAPTIAVYVGGRGPIRQQLERAAGRADGLGFRFEVGRVPNAVGVRRGSHADVEGGLASARRRYIDAQFAACIEALGERERVHALLEEERRDLAARVLFWRVACLVGGARATDATREARALAVFGLRTPADVDAATPEVEEVLAAARREIEHTPPVPVRIAVDHDGATVGVDGAPRQCTAPCVIDLAPGDHVISVGGDGVAPAHRLVRVDSPGSSIQLGTSAASPALAARQWVARYAASEAIDGSQSVALLARAVRHRRVVVLASEPASGSAARLRAVLAVDGQIASRAERTSAASDVDRGARALLRDLLVRGRLLEEAPALHRRPAFWIAIGVVGLAAAGGTAYALDRDRRTGISF